jgi:hypothetical protein
MTPVTLIKIVREELKGDVKEVKEDVKHVEDRMTKISTEISVINKSMGLLSGEVATSNRLQADLNTIIRDELKAKRDGDIVIRTTQAEVVRHREITDIDDSSAERKDKLKSNSARRRNIARVVTLITSTAFITTITTLLAGRC